FHLAPQDAVAEVQDPLVLAQHPVADVEGLVLDKQADELAGGGVDHRLAVLRIAEAGLGVRQRADLVEAAEVCPGDAVGLTLVQVSAQPDVTVGQREHRLGLGQVVQVKLGLADRPRLDGERGVLDHDSSSSSARSCTTTLAPCWLRASAWPWPTRSTPTTYPNSPSWPACTPATASSNTAACAGDTPSARAPARNMSGAGLPLRCSSSAVCPSTRASNRSSMPAATSTSLQLALEETTAR